MKPSPHTHPVIADLVDANRILFHQGIVEYAVDSGEAVAADAPRPYLERFIRSEIFKARPDVMAVVHHHSPGRPPIC